MLKCAFATSGFTLPTHAPLPPCHVSYHTQCFRVGRPFTSRLRRGEGLTFPKVKHWGTFICELCTVRAVLGREVSRQSDIELLRLERMRVIDMANAWASGTHTQYQSKLSSIRSFELFHDFPILQRSSLSRPPDSIDIPLMWIQESYSLRPSSRADDSLVSFATVRSLRSAASQFLGWEMMVSSPLSTFIDQQQRVLHQPCRATDSYSFTLFTKGISGRLGTDSQPATALLFRHVFFMDSYFLANYRASTTDASRRRWALAGLANALFWLGWFRSSEVFNLTYNDVDVVPPRDGPTYDLPPNLGMVLCRLLPQTKTNRTSTADIVMAYSTLSGLSVGSWCSRVSRTFTGSSSWPSHHTGLIFLQDDGTQWTSNYFRQTFVYPCLEQLQQLGDAYLTPFTGDGNSLADRFFSIHMYRRGGRSQSTRGGSHHGYTFKKASKEQVYAHGRWRRRRGSEAIDVQYDQWTYADRIAISLFSL